MSNDHLRPYAWCFCQQERGGTMVECSSGNCYYEWFHLKCIGKKRAPKNDWICDGCKVDAALTGKVTDEEIHCEEEAPTGKFNKLVKRAMLGLNIYDPLKAAIDKNSCARTRPYVDCFQITPKDLELVHRGKANVRMLRAENRERVANGLNELPGDDDTREYMLKVHRSSIHSQGLFALVALKPNLRLLEYRGEIIRASLADFRERMAKIDELDGFYMFKIDTHNVIDATRYGNMARFMNHSCDANCIARVDNGKIYIYSIKRIEAGEELSYNYKFPYENGKFNCKCGVSSCRKFLS